MTDEPPKKKQNVRFPGEVDETYPEVFTKMPPQPKEKKPGQLSEELIKEYFDKVTRFVLPVLVLLMAWHHLQVRFSCTSCEMYLHRRAWPHGAMSH